MHTSKFLHNTVHYYLPAIIAALIFAGAMCDVYNFDANVYDYGLFTNITWNFSQGDGWLASFYADSHRENFLGDHWALLIAIIAQIFYIFPSAYTYAVLHSIALGSIFFIIPLFVRQIWHEEERTDYYIPTLLLTLILFLFKGFMGAVTFQVYMTTLVMPFILGALYCLHRKKLWGTCLCCLIVALSQERGAVAVAGIGVYAFLITNNKRLGFILCLLSTIYFILAIKVFIPSFTANENYMYGGMVEPLALLKKKNLYLLTFMASWLFLPLLGKKAVFALGGAFPLFALALVSNRDGMLEFSYHYQNMHCIFVLAAATFGLLFLWKKYLQRPKLSKFFMIVACAGLIISARTSYWVSPMFQIEKTLANPTAHQVHKDLKPYTNIDKDIYVYSTSGIGSHLALRKYIKALTTEHAHKDFNKSVFIMTPNINVYPNTSAKELETALRSNPNLHLITDTGELLVFSSRDITKADIIK